MMRAALVSSALLVASGCGGGGPSFAMSFMRTSSLYDAPFPSDDLRHPDGTLDLSKVPNPNHVALIDQALALLTRDARGFALAGGIFFRASAPLDPASLPDLHGSITDHASVFLVGVDPAAPDYLVRHPLDVAFLADGGPFGDRNLLALLPLQGTPLEPNERYAAVVTTRVQGPHGRAVSQSAEMAALAHGGRPAGLTDPVYAEYRGALTAIAPLVPASQVAALAVFTTDDPTLAVGVVRDDARAHHPIAPPQPPPVLGDQFNDYCVYQATLSVPVYQRGTPPYSMTGGDWTFDAAGHPIFDHFESSRIFFTIPHGPTPAGGWPTVVFVRTGGGGDRPLIDRGKCATPEFTTAITPGSGPAMELARAGFAGVEIDGPLGGIRNTTQGNEDFLIFNFQNAAALRDNIRQSALELALLADTLPQVSFDAHDCPGVGTAPFTIDGAHLALMGHSMGAWIAPLTLAFAPRYGAAVLSGAGASYIANVMDKLKPVAIRPLAEALLDFDMDNRDLDAHDPALTLVQWAAEPSDPQVYDRRIVREPQAGEPARQVLMIQGIVDHYILPSIASATSLALGLDLAGPDLDQMSPEEMMLGQRPLALLLPFAGLQELPLPASQNRVGPSGALVTAVVVQHPADGIEDGHEVMFQTDPPKHQYRCFLSGFLRGKATVPPDGAADDPCP